MQKYNFSKPLFKFISKPLRNKLEHEGFAPEIRLTPDGQEFVSDNGNHIIDLNLLLIKEPQTLATRLDAIPGVVDHGLFLGYADKVIMAEGDVVIVFER